MISDSTPWREDLLRVADRLKIRSVQKRWTERTSYLVERDLMLGAYAVRRLSESYKLSDELRDRTVQVTRFEATGRPVHSLTRHQIDQNYRLEKGTQERREVVKVCNTLIHSFVWVLSAGESGAGFDGVYVSSDREKTRSLVMVPLRELLDLFRAVGNENIVASQWTYDTRTGRQVARNFTPETVHLMDPRPGGVSIERLEISSRPKPLE